MQAGDHPTILSPGDVLGSYRIDSFLGQGGFGVTYVARDTMLDIQVAIKEYLPERIARRAADKTIQPRSEEHAKVVRKGLISFLKEARTLAKFKHPNIVRVMSIFELNNTAYMVMEYERGHELKLLLDQRKNISEVALKALFGPILDGLEEVHRHGFIHRDIKPANILVRDDGSPVLLDFGSARLASGHQTELLTAMVTAGFAPLEQYSGLDEQQGPWTDIYALGAVLYYAVRALAPVDSTLRGVAVLNDKADPFQSLSSLKPEGYSVAFCRAVDWALQFKVSARPQSLRQWSSGLFQDEQSGADVVQERSARDSIGTSASRPSSMGVPSSAAEITRLINPVEDFGKAAPTQNRGVADQPTRPVTQQELTQNNTQASSTEAYSMQSSLDNQDTYEYQRTENIAQPNSSWDVSDVSSYRQKRRKKAGFNASFGLKNWRVEQVFSRKTVVIALSFIVASLVAIVAVQQPDNTLGVSAAATKSKAEVPESSSTTNARPADDRESANNGGNITESLNASDESSVTNVTSLPVPVDSSANRQTAEAQASRLLALRQRTEAEAAAQLASDRSVQLEEARRQSQIQRDRDARAATDAAREAAAVRREAARQEQLAKAALETDAEKLAAQQRNQFVQPPDVAVKPVIARSDMSDVLTRFNGLSNALRERDGAAMRRYTVESRRNNAYFDYVFSSFDTVETRIANISASRQDQTIRATLWVDRLIRANGTIAIPPEEFKSIPIYSTKESQWSAIHW